MPRACHRPPTYRPREASSRGTRRSRRCVERGAGGSWPTRSPFSRGRRLQPLTRARLPAHADAASGPDRAGRARGRARPGRLPARGGDDGGRACPRGRRRDPHRRPAPGHRQGPGVGGDGAGGRRAGGPDRRHGRHGPGRARRQPASTASSATAPSPASTSPRSRSSCRRRARRGVAGRCCWEGPPSGTRWDGARPSPSVVDRALAPGPRVLDRLGLDPVRRRRAGRSRRLLARVRRRRLGHPVARVHGPVRALCGRHGLLRRHLRPARRHDRRAALDLPDLRRAVPRARVRRAARGNTSRGGCTPCGGGRRS